MKQLTPTSAKAIAATAYLFAFPLVMRYRQMSRQAIDATSPMFSGGFGTWLEGSVTEPRRSGSGRPMEDVVYSSTWLDLRGEPWWCALGDVPAEVSFVGSLVDLWGFLIADLEPGRSGPVLASSPAPVRGVPDQVEAVVRGESEFVQVCTESRWSDPYRLPGVPPVRPDLVLEPLSAHLGRPAPRPAAAMTWSPWFEGLEATDEFWACANFVLSLTEPNPDDRSILERIAQIGVIPGAPWTPSAHPEAVLEAIRDGMDDAISDLLEGAVGADVCRRPRTRRADMDRDYFSRALAALCPSVRVDG